MNKILKQILLTAEGVAETETSQRIPGASLIIGGVHKLVDKDAGNNLGAILDLESGIIQAVNGLKQEEVIDPVALNTGIGELTAGFAHIRGAIKS